MKNYIFVISKIQGTDGKLEVGNWSTNFEIEVEAGTIESAENKFKKIYPEVLSDEGWTFLDITCNVFLLDIDSDTRKFLYEFGTSGPSQHGGKRTGAGRKEVSEPRMARSIKFTDAEWDAVKRKAANENMTASDYVRKKVL